MFRFVVNFNIEAKTIEEAYALLEQSISPMFNVDYETDQMFDKDGKVLSEKQESEVLMDYIMSAKE